MANDENLKKGVVTQFRSGEEAARNGRKGGKASGRARRRKADFRKTLNVLLTTEIDSPEWTPFLKAQGLDSTLESAVNAAMIREALAGNVKAYEAIAKYSGQTAGTDADDEEQKARTEALKEKVKKDDKADEMSELLKNIQTMADIIKNPVPDRDIQDFE